MFQSLRGLAAVSAAGTMVALAVAASAGNRSAALWLLFLSLVVIASLAVRLGIALWNRRGERRRSRSLERQYGASKLFDCEVVAGSSSGMGTVFPAAETLAGTDFEPSSLSMVVDRGSALFFMGEATDGPVISVPLSRIELEPETPDRLHRRTVVGLRFDSSRTVLLLRLRSRRFAGLVPASRRERGALRDAIRHQGASAARP